MSLLGAQTFHFFQYLDFPLSWPWSAGGYGTKQANGIVMKLDIVQRAIKQSSYIQLILTNSIEKLDFLSPNMYRLL